MSAPVTQFPLPPPLGGVSAGSAVSCILRPRLRVRRCIAGAPSVAGEVASVFACTWSVAARKLARRHSGARQHLPRTAEITAEANGGLAGGYPLFVVYAPGRNCNGAERSRRAGSWRLGGR